MILFRSKEYSMTTVSAIITTYNREIDILNRAVKSVLDQTFEDLELIIVDDNGLHTDVQERNEKYVSELKHKDNRIQYVPLKRNHGVQYARNTGIDLAKGEYIAFLDDDDIWWPQKIKKQLAPFLADEEKELGLVYCYHERIIESSTGKEPKAELMEYPCPDQEKVLTELSRSNYIGSTSFPLLKKEVFEKIGKFDLSLEASQDYDMWIRIAEHYKIECINEPLVTYLIHPGDRISKNNKRKAIAEITFLKKHYELISIDHTAMHIKHRSIGIYLMRMGMGKESRKYFLTAIRHKPFTLRAYKYYLESFFFQVKNKYKSSKVK